MPFYVAKLLVLGSNLEAFPKMSYLGYFSTDFGVLWTKVHYFEVGRLISGVIRSKICFSGDVKRAKISWKWAKLDQNESL